MASSSELDGNPELYLTARAGSQVRLTANAASGVGPVWSPTADRLACVAAVGFRESNPLRGLMTDLYAVKADGSPYVPLANGPEPHAVADRRLR